MTPENKARWAAALRSGKYQQGHGVLRDLDDQVCCLGVAIDVFAPERWEFIQGEWCDRDFGIVELPQQDFLDMLGLTHKEAQNFAGLNDDEQLSFVQIASYIERHDDYTENPTQEDIHGA